MEVHLQQDICTKKPNSFTTESTEDTEKRNFLPFFSVLTVMKILEVFIYLFYLDPLKGVLSSPPPPEGYKCHECKLNDIISDISPGCYFNGKTSDIRHYHPPLRGISAMNVNLTT
jgi:hypothetical protein